MNDWFEWNGVRCTEYGIYVSEQPPITLPQERSTQTKIPGRPGSLTTLEGDDVYDDLTLTATCFIRNPERIPAIASWLKGGGTVTFANRPGGFYHARIANQIPFEKILRGNPHCSFAVNFRCSPPFWYMSNPDEVTITNGSAVVVNPGSVYSEPIIHVYGSGDITLILNDTFIELEGIEDGIVLNSVILENGGYPVIVSTVLGYLVIVSSVLRVKCYGVQSTGYRVIVSKVLRAILDIVRSSGPSIVKNQILYRRFIYNGGALCYSWSITTGQCPERKKT